MLVINNNKYILAYTLSKNNERWRCSNSVRQKHVSYEILLKDKVQVTLQFFQIISKYVSSFKIF